MVSFLSRVSIAWTVLSRDVCLSVTSRYSVDTAEHILNFLLSGSSTILVFPRQTLWGYSDGDPLLLGASNARGMKQEVKVI